MRYSIFLVLLLSACSSAPKYENMRTIESAVSSGHVQPGMAITKTGAVVDIQVEEVQAQKRKLEAMIAERDQTIRALREENAALLDKNRTLRVHAGLSANEPKAESECCTASGALKSFKPAPTLDQELALAHKTPPAPAAATEVTEDELQ